jgi:hypothetical protein
LRVSKSVKPYTFLILVPAGYKIWGLDKMLIKKENEYFSFTNSFSEKGDVVTVGVSMTCEVSAHDTKQCEELVPFITEIQNIYEATLLLKKQ